MKPSQARRKGREDFDHDTDPDEVCPFKLGTNNYEYWMEGWHKEAIEYKREEERKFSEELEFDRIQCGCPWISDDLRCEVNTKDCSIENCAPYYLIKKVQEG